MEKIDLDISGLSLAQKLNLMESIWEDITQDESAIESPAWHEEVLKGREDALASGKANVSDWETAKERIRRDVS